MLYTHTFTYNTPTLHNNSYNPILQLPPFKSHQPPLNPHIKPMKRRRQTPSTDHTESSTRVKHERRSTGQTPSSDHTESSTRVKHERRSTRRQSLPSDTDTDDDGDNEDHSNKRIDNNHYDSITSLRYLKEAPPIQVREHTQNKWERLPQETKDKLAKITGRLLLFKGGNKDKVTMDHVKDAIGHEQSEYKSHSQSALQVAQNLLQQSLGYNVMCRDMSNIFVVNELRSPALLRILSANDREAGYRGFCAAVLMAVATSPSRSCDLGSLLRMIRKIDPRFAESSISATGRKKDSSGIEDLNEHGFLSLLQRMVKEGYLVESKDNVAESSGPSSKVYTLGSRFHVEFGLKQLSRAYFVSIGERVDEEHIRTIDEPDIFAEESGRGGEEESKQRRE